MKVLSIAVPAYNMEKYLGRCLESMLAENIMDKIEVIIINDGSKDSTIEIARDFEKKYPSTCIAVDKENGGHGSGVNKGIELATGKYFKIVDADDWVNTESLIKLVSHLENCNTDVIATHYNTVSMVDNTVKTIFCKNVQFEKIYKIAQIADLGINLVMHSITYKTSILKQNSIKLQENTFYVDNEYNLLPIPFLETVEFLDIKLYQYLIGRPNQSVARENMAKYNEHLLRVLKRLIIFYEKTDMSEGQRLYVLNFLKQLIGPTYHYYAIMSQKSLDNIKVVREFDAFLRNSSLELYNAITDKYISSLRKSNFNLILLLSLIEPTWRYKVRPILVKTIKSFLKIES